MHLIIVPEKQTSLKKPSRGFVQQFVRFYFNHRNNPSLVETTLNGFTNQGYDMSSFYWCDPSLEASDEDLRKILRQNEYGFQESDIEKMLKTEPAPLPDFRGSKVVTYPRHQRQSV